MGNIVKYTDGKSKQHMAEVKKVHGNGRLSIAWAGGRNQSVDPAVATMASDMEAAAHNAEMLEPPAAEKRLRAAAVLNDAELPAGKRQRHGSQIASTTTSGLPVHSTATNTTNPAAAATTTTTTSVPPSPHICHAV